MDITYTYRKLFWWTKLIVFQWTNKPPKDQYVISDLKLYFIHILQFGEGVSTLFSNFGDFEHSKC